MIPFPRVILTALALGAVVGAGGCTGDPPSRAAEGPKRAAGSPAGQGPRASAVSVAAVEARAVERSVDATGSLLAWQEVVLNTSIQGTVARLLVDLGDVVQAGQTVAELDRREVDLAVEQAEAGVRAAQDALLRARTQVDVAQARLQQVPAGRRTLVAGLTRAQAALAEAQSHLERTRRLVEQGLVAQRDLDGARTQYETARAQLQAAQVELEQYPDRLRVVEAQLQSELAAVRVAEADLQRRDADRLLARKRLGDTILLAPIAGSIARRHVNPGEYIRENTAVLTIVRSDPLKFSGTVAERAALEVRPGQVVRFRVEPAPDRRFAGRVTRVSPAVDVTSRTVLLEAEVPNREGHLRPGLFARGAIVLREDRDVAFVPETAVSYLAGLTRVFVVAEGTAQERTVRLGSRAEGFVEVVEGVRPGEQVATSGLAQLRDGAAVTTAPAEGRRGPRSAPDAPAGSRPGRAAGG